ncbi:MAG: hypothetical protein AAFW01_05210 [Pseudomonadota bacterium]
MARIAGLALLLGAAATLSGCAVVALSAAGGVAATEIEENDGKFDPLENTKAGQKLDALIN